MSLRAWFLCIVLTVLAVAPVSASPPGRPGAAPVAANPLQPFESRAAEALLIEADTETVLFDKASDERVPPASLAKLMTMAVVFDALKTGRLHLDDMFIVSENAWRKGGAPAGGTTMFAKLGSSIKVRDLIRGAIVQSANDACLILAEGMAGTEANFVGLMNAEAARLGLTGSRFTSAMGAADPQQTVTARDLVRLARHVIFDFPEYYGIYREPSFNWNAINQNNRNPLIAMNIGADGLVTGGTDQTGFALVGSATQGGQRLILAILGLGSDRQRADEAKKLLDWGFRSFEKVRLFAPGDLVGDAAVFGGDRAAVGVVSKDGLEAFLPRGGRDLVKGRVVYQGPIKAPIVKGQPIGDLELSIAGQVIRQAPVYAAEDVAVGSLPQRAFDGLRELLLGWR